MQKQGKILRDGQNGNGLVSSQGEKYEFDIVTHWKSDTPPQLGGEVYVELDEAGKVVSVESIESVKQAKLARRKQGTVLRDGQNGKGLLSSQGEKYEFDLIEHWKSDAPPRVGMTIFFELDDAGKLLFVKTAAAANPSAAGSGQGSRPVPPPSAIPSNARNTAMIAHLLGIITGFIGALIIWLINNGSDAPDDAGKAFIVVSTKEALNFQFTLLIIGFVLTVTFIGAFLLPVLWILDMVFSIVGAVSASNGKVYRYPMSLRLFK
ncbi:MAG: DUF4870 domain-containing protein [Zoogloeaceae bacterium]|jgi:uncharacterized Tic20 family protein|nr:DUF4870 domain-containing protein [Zoogloeaceae bacterium]